MRLIEKVLPPTGKHSATVIFFHGSGDTGNNLVEWGSVWVGALAMHTGYHLNTNLAGVFALSSFLNRESIVYESLDHHDSSVPLPPLKMFHGERDNLVPIEWARRTFNELKKRCITGDFTSLPNTLHELKKSEMLSIEKWLKEILPPLESDLNNKL
ncbi:hypothetical protein PVAND_004977 [Polypedilum vanderplanki]|uniref:palmitoyl-protein hydrolase n=1 Tax=Polypedilum vanderplanki TaxID=319348 RepID=A0A9J6C0M8_POLVA|nr:hypothetical protein PVAND_004977 [Polypedilum vanderplanki]